MKKAARRIKDVLRLYIEGPKLLNQHFTDEQQKVEVVVEKTI